LSGVLKAALERQGYGPARLPEEMLAWLTEEELQAFGIEGTERRFIGRRTTTGNGSTTAVKKLRW